MHRAVYGAAYGGAVVSVTRLAVPMGPLFRACSAVLDEEMRPLHYAELTRRARARLFVSESEVPATWAKEDVREKMLARRKFGCVYLEAPHCLAAKGGWWSGAQMELGPSLFPPVAIHGSSSAGIEGAFEALMRAPHMLIKTAASTQSINIGRARGLVIEAHVRQWFAAKWPEFYVAADNEGRWEMPCAHDFKLRVGGSMYLVDVFNPNLDGSVSNRSGKRGVHLHLHCESIGNDVVWHAVIKGADYRGVIPAHRQMTPARLVVWLNCAAVGLDYVELGRMAAAS